MSRHRLASWLPITALVALAAIGPLFTGSAQAPSIAPSAAQLLPPGTHVEEVGVEGGGFVRGLEIDASGPELRVRSTSGWRSLPGAAAIGSPRSRTMGLGTDHQGRDLVARAVFGARTSLTIALLAAAVAVMVGTLVGLGTALGRWPAGPALLLLADGSLALPRLLLLLMLGVCFRGSPGGVALAIGLASWMEVSRLVAAEARAIRARPFTAAARASGAGGLRLGLRHILPNLRPILAVSLPFVATEAVVLESTLGYLGVGGDPGAASWGRMIADGQRLLPSGWALVVFPGVLLCLTALSLSRLERGQQPKEWVVQE